MIVKQLQTPTYLLRRRIVLHYLSSHPERRLLEIGCGRGELLQSLAQRGYHGLGLDISPEAARVAMERLAPYPAVDIVNDPSDVAGQFDVILALEVLEHIKDDKGTLQRWTKWLSPGGVLVLTVPAHERYWTASDDFGGHVRRYERASLQNLVNESGLAIETFWSFGFPLTAITIPIRDFVYRKASREMQGVSRHQRVLKSSFDSRREFPGSRVLGTMLEGIGLIFHWLQLPFLRTDLGGSYLVACRHRSDG